METWFIPPLGQRLFRNKQPNGTHGGLRQAQLREPWALKREILLSVGFLGRPNLLGWVGGDGYN